MIRLLLCLAVVAFFALCAAGMRWGWRNRARRQSCLPPLPVPPTEFAGEPLLPTMTGAYVSTTTADNWQDRIELDTGLRADDKDTYDRWITAIRALARGAVTGPRGGEDR
jgi:hypothetical protein